MKPLCFVLMPFGRKPEGTGRIIDFDAVYNQIIAPGVEAAGMEPIRADQEEIGGTIHKPMFERLMLCDYAVADVTGANPTWSVDHSHFSEQTTGTSSSYNIDIAGEAKFMGIGVEGSISHGFEKGSSQSISWATGWYMEGKTEGLPDGTSHQVDCNRFWFCLEAFRGYCHPLDDCSRPADAAILAEEIICLALRFVRSRGSNCLSNKQR